MVEGDQRREGQGRVTAEVSRPTSRCRGRRPAALRLLACAPERGRWAAQEADVECRHSGNRDVGKLS